MKIHVFKVTSVIVNFFHISLIAAQIAPSPPHLNTPLSLSLWPSLWHIEVPWLARDQHFATVVTMPDP